MKRHILTPDRWVSVEDGTVRDLDGNTLGHATKTHGGLWEYATCDGQVQGWCATQASAVRTLLADPSCPTPGPNRYDRP